VLRVLVADDNPTIRLGLRALLDGFDDLQVVGEAVNGREAVDLAAALRPEVVLLDVRMPVVDGVAAAVEIARDRAVLMLTYADDAQVVAAAIRAGASGYLVHGTFDPEELAEAIREVAGGGIVLAPAIAPAIVDALRRTGERQESMPVLTEREFEVMDLVVKGATNTSIARTMSISEKTVKNHINHIYGKLGVVGRSEAIALWLGIGK